MTDREERMTERQTLSKLLNEDLDNLKQAGQDEAEAERQYRKHKAMMSFSPDMPEGLSWQKQNWIDGQCADLRFVRDHANNLKGYYKEAVQSRRQQISILQTEMNRQRDEMGSYQARQIGE